MDSWLKQIVDFALDTQMISKDLAENPQEIPGKTLEQIWERLFDGVETLLITQLIYPKVLLEWTKTPEGKKRLKKHLKQRL